ncbi:MAG: NAD(+) synthase [Desulfamplus sp.]|nr:NAD(+) synthase [Desulfamplus sp.]
MLMEKIVNHISSWLKDYCLKSGLNGFVVGVSGGIDSAVTSTLCGNTGLKVIALNMPIYQSPSQLNLANSHINWLENHFKNVKGVTVDLTPSFKEIQESLPKEIQDGLTMANTRSRLRMLTLYAFASHHKLLVAGTGNKVEDFGVGFYTKYGDGGVDISPIADLFKTEVFAIGRYLGINEDIINAPPTDGLWEDGRTDESQIGATYPELEWAMRYEENKSYVNCSEYNVKIKTYTQSIEQDRFKILSDEESDENLLSSRQKEVLSIYRRFNNMNRHKMEPIPVCKIPYGLNSL